MVVCGSVRDPRLIQATGPKVTELKYVNVNV